MKWQKRVLSPSVNIRAEPKTAPSPYKQYVANLVKAGALPSLYTLSGIVLAISSAYLWMFNTPYLYDKVINSQKITPALRLNLSPFYFEPAIGRRRSKQGQWIPVGRYLF